MVIHFKHDPESGERTPKPQIRNEHIQPFSRVSSNPIAMTPTVPLCLQQAQLFSLAAAPSRHFPA